VRGTWWQEQRDEVVDGFLVEPQNQGRSDTTWEPSHEWRLAEATPSSRGLQWYGFFITIPSNGFAAMLTVKICQPSHEFTFGVGMTFVSYPLVLTPVV
jgi:hypothetical protein